MSADKEYAYTIVPPSYCPKCGSENITVKWVYKGRYHGAFLRCSDCRATIAIPLIESGGVRTSTAIQKWSQRIRRRDGMKCAICGSTIGLNAHHIIPVAVDPDQALNDANGICLCRECHHKAHMKKGDRK